MTLIAPVLETAVSSRVGVRSDNLESKMVSCLLAGITAQPDAMFEGESKDEKDDGTHRDTGRDPKQTSDLQSDTEDEVFQRFKNEDRVTF